MNAIIDIKKIAVVAFENVFEEGDRWNQIVGCEACTSEGQCCGRCKMRMPSGDCRLHVEDPGQKPCHCVIFPNPTQTWSWCAIQFQCVKGSRMGEIIKAKSKDVD